MSHRGLFIALLSLAACFRPEAVSAQPTAFTYQGKLTSNGAAASGQFDFQFGLFDSASGGTELGSVLTVSSVTVSAGTFTVPVDFSPCAGCFTGAARFLEIAVKASGAGSFTTLSPRQLITSTPYAIRSSAAGAADGLSVSCVNCITSAQIASVAGSAVTGAIPVASVPSGSASYIQNRTSVQSSSNFNISGNGVVGGSIGVGTTPTASLDVVDTASQIRFGDTTADNGGFLVSTSASQANLAGGAKWNGAAWVAKSTAASQMDQNGGTVRWFTDSGLTVGTTFGPTERFRINSAGNVGVGLTNPSAKLDVAGDINTSTEYDIGGARILGAGGTHNVFAGIGTGAANTGSQNSFFGALAGAANTSGGNNSFFGFQAGLAHQTTSNNSFFGSFAGTADTTGSNNAFFGESAGSANTNGTNNAFFGFHAGDANTIGDNNTVIGANADVGLGSLAFATAIGAGAVAGASNSITLGRANGADTVIVPGSIKIGGVLTAEPAGIFVIEGLENIANPIQIGFPSESFKTMNIAPGDVRINGTLEIIEGVGGTSVLCINDNSGSVGHCSSSIRYKEHVDSFRPGLGLIRALRPVSFDWKSTGRHDFGLVAEEVADVEPLLVSHNDKGEVEGVLYERLPVVLINAVKEQQAEIERQQAQIKRLQDEIGLLRAAVCASNAHAPTCESR